jgi:hypothetical protein
LTFDISTLAATEDTVDIDINNPATGDPLLGDGGKPCSVSVYGPSSKAFAAARAAQGNRNMRRARARGGRSDTTPEEDAADTATFLAAITTSFNNFNYQGKPNEPATFKALYLDRTMGWLTSQINSQAGDWANFTKAAADN